MPLRIQLMPEYVHVSWHGELTKQDLDTLSVEMPRVGRQLGRAPNVLHTFEDARATQLSYEAMHRYGRDLQYVKVPNPCRIASVCDRSLSYGLARMMQQLNQNPDLEMEVFSNLDAALSWLKAGQADPASKR